MLRNSENKRADFDVDPLPFFERHCVAFDKSLSLSHSTTWEVFFRIFQTLALVQLSFSFLWGCHCFYNETWKLSCWFDMPLNFDISLGTDENCLISNLFNDLFVDKTRCWFESIFNFPNINLFAFAVLWYQVFLNIFINIKWE